MSNKIKLRRSGVSSSSKKKLVLKSSGNKIELKAAANYLKEGNIVKSAKAYRDILSKNPNNLEANYHLASLYNHIGRPESGIQLLEKIIDFQPEHIETNLLLGEMYAHAGQFDESHKIFIELIEFTPNNSRIHFKYSEICHYSGEIDKALEHLNKAIKINPKFVRAYNHKGRIYSALGNTDFALNLFRKARNIDPFNGESHYNIAQTYRHNEYSDDIIAMENADKCQKLSKDDKIHIKFALGKVFDDIGEFEKSFHYISEANRRKRKTLPFHYSVSREKAFFDKLKKEFNSKFIERSGKMYCESSKPIFIVGMPRSGTTLVEQILASHSAVYGAGELQLINLLCKKIELLSGSPFPTNTNRLTETDWQNLSAEYVEKISQLSSKEFIVDKMPHNFRYIGLIRTIFPNAKIIHCKRKAEATCFSIYKHHFSFSHAYASNLKELGNYYLLYQDLMEYWNKLFGDKIYNLQYESLIDTPNRSIKNLLDYCNLPFEESCLYYFDNKRTVNTPSAQQVRKPIYRKALHHWMNYSEKLESLKNILNSQSTKR